MNKWQIMLDCGMCACIAFIVFFAVKQGFIKSFFKYTKIIVVIAITLILGSYLVGVCQEGFVEDYFEGKVSGVIVKKAEQYGEKFTFEDIKDEIPAKIRKVVPMKTMEKYYNSLTDDGIEAAQKLALKVEDFVIEVTSKIIAYLGTFILSYILCTIGVAILDKTCKLPVLNGCNKLLGFFWGLAHAYIFVSFAVCVAVLVWGGDFVNGTRITRFIFKYGLFTH